MLGNINLIDVFCDVIDNYGDAGVCLRFCRDISRRNIFVNLICNNVNILNDITNTEDKKNQFIKIKEWPSEKDNYAPADVIIQAFSVRLPSFIYTSIKNKKSLVVNLEYLTAEKFAEDCHMLPSYSEGIESFFFFPGFTRKTGGLIIEDELLRKIKKSGKSNKLREISLFSYENAQVRNFIDRINDDMEYAVNVFEGKALDNINNEFGVNLKPGQKFNYRNIEFNCINMVSQDEYDDILCSSDINLVRGEDSIARAMIIGKPFLWNIYPQDGNYHENKINALFDRMNEFCDDKNSVEILRNITLSYNGLSDYLKNFDFKDFFEDWKKISLQWSLHIQSLGNLTDNFLEFLYKKVNQK